MVVSPDSTGFFSGGFDQILFEASQAADALVSRELTGV
jgi:hypothetical protein